MNKASIKLGFLTAKLLLLLIFFQTPILGVEITGLENVMPTSKQGFVALISYKYSNGPGGEKHQMVLYREKPEDFQCLRKWISESDFENESTITNAQDPFYYDEVLSVVSNHVFSAILSTGNITEYTPTNHYGVIQQTRSFGYKNMLINNYEAKYKFYSALRGTGMTSVTNVDHLQTGDRFRVATYKSTDAVMSIHSDADKNTWVFDLYDERGNLVERSEFDKTSDKNNGNGPLATLETESQSAAQLFFCKIFWRQTEGWVWHSMLR